MENGGCKKVENGGVLCKKKWKTTGVFCKKVDFSSTQGASCRPTVSVFLFYIYLLGGAYAPNAPPPPTGLVVE